MVFHTNRSEFANIGTQVHNKGTSLVSPIGITNYEIQIIRRVKTYFPKENLITLANSHVMCHLDYCAPLRLISVTQLGKNFSSYTSIARD